MKNPKTEEHANEFTKNLMEATFNTINNAKVNYGPEFINEVTLNFLGSVVCTLVLNRLKTLPEGLSEDEVSRYYQNYKSDIQTAISSGFEAAFTDFTGSAVDYYTEINPLPEMASKYLN